MTVFLIINKINFFAELHSPDFVRIQLMIVRINMVNKYKF